MTVVSGNVIRLMRIFVGVPWRRGVKRQRGNRKRRFSELGGQESRAVARKPRDAAAVLFGLNFADNIHHKFKSSQASKAMRVRQTVRRRRSKVIGYVAMYSTLNVLYIADDFASTAFDVHIT